MLALEVMVGYTNQTSHPSKETQEEGWQGRILTNIGLQDPNTKSTLQDLH